jgi:hypothetical protein
VDNLECGAAVRTPAPRNMESTFVRTNFNRVDNYSLNDQPLPLMEAPVALAPAPSPRPDEATVGVAATPLAMTQQQQRLAERIAGAPATTAATAAPQQAKKPKKIVRNYAVEHVRTVLTKLVQEWPTGADRPTITYRLVRRASCAKGQDGGGVYTSSDTPAPCPQVFLIFLVGIWSGADVEIATTAAPAAPAAAAIGPLVTALMLRLLLGHCP